MTKLEQIEFSAFIEDSFNAKAIDEIASNTNFMNSQHLASLEIKKRDVFDDIRFLVLGSTSTILAFDKAVLMMEALYYKRKYESVIAVEIIIEDAKNKAAVQS